MTEPTFGPSIGVEIEIWESQDEVHASKEMDEFSDIFPKIVSGEYDLENIDAEFLARLFPYKLAWKDFEEWHRYFDEINYFPYMWSGLEGQQPEIGQETINYLSDFAGLSLPARKILIHTNYYKATKQKTKKLYDFKRQSDIPPQEFQKAFAELKGDFVKDKVSIKDRLRLLRVKDLKPILEKFDLKKSGRKNELITRLYEEVSDKELENFLTSEAKEDMVVSKKWLPKEDKEAIKFHDKKIGLLAHTTRSLRATQRQLNSALEMDRRTLEINSVDNCPVCYEKEGKVKVSNENLEKLPPFHPGCRCGISVSFDGEFSSSGKKVSNKAESGGGCLTVSLVGVLLTFIIVYSFLF